MLPVAQSNNYSSIKAFEKCSINGCHSLDAGGDLTFQEKSSEVPKLMTYQLQCPLRRHYPTIMPLRYQCIKT